MTPLRIHAQVESLIGPRVMLDGLIAAAIAEETGLPPIGVQSQAERADITMRLRALVAEVLTAEPGGRFHLCSEGLFAPAAHERRYLHRRFPTTQAAAIGNHKIRRIETATGPSKSFRIPQSQVFLQDGITWFAVANRASLVGLLDRITHLGKRRAVGCGRVESWSVDPCEPWDGFPVLREGRPLRALPLDYPGLRDFRTEMRAITFPYWEFAHEQPCACP